MEDHLLGLQASIVFYFSRSGDENTACLLAHKVYNLRLRICIYQIPKQIIHRVRKILRICVSISCKELRDFNSSIYIHSYHGDGSNRDILGTLFF